MGIGGGPRAPVDMADAMVATPITKEENMDRESTIKVLQRYGIHSHFSKAEFAQLLVDLGFTPPPEVLTPPPVPAFAVLASPPSVTTTPKFTAAEKPLGTVHSAVPQTVVASPVVEERRLDPTGKVLNPIPPPSPQPNPLLGVPGKPDVTKKKPA